MLDNMDPATVCEAIATLHDEGLREGLEVECSGGITPLNAREYADAGADVISMGALTMSAPALDINFSIVAVTD
jgi:nicotinate-nucleotide pyrophosphorylase (carboxylating)